MVVSPELAEVLSTIIRRVRGTTGAVPIIAAYDRAECAWLAPSPWLFQHRYGVENRRICGGTIRNMLNAALAQTGLIDPADGRPLHYTPHDFRRIFITDAIMSGLPPHIAQIIAGHRDINVTLGYKAVYPDEAIQAHLGSAYSGTQRVQRPTRVGESSSRRSLINTASCHRLTSSPADKSRTNDQGPDLDLPRSGPLPATLLWAILGLNQ